MSTARPFAYNTSGPIDGTSQVGDLTIGFPTTGFTDNPQFWNGPDEDLGYVIGIPVSGNTQPTPIDGVFASLGFFRSSDLTDNSFLELANSLFNQSFSSATDASLWLTNNGYWNSYISPLLYLDAGNSASYPGTGTTWTDLVGGKVFNLVNGPGYDPADGGKIYFYANGGQYAICNTSLPSLTTWSVGVWHYYTGANTGSLPCIVTETYTGGEINYSLGNNTGSGLTSGFFNGGWQVTGAYSLTPNNWYYIVGTYDGNANNLYVNNVLVQSNSYVGTPTTSNAGIRLMERWDSNDYWDGWLSTVGIYGKALTAGQVNSIWYSTKSRYGYTGDTFTLSQSDFTNLNSYGTYISPLTNPNDGFTTTGQGGPGEAFYSPSLSLSNGGNPTKLAEIRNFWTTNGLTVDSNAYMFNVTWGSGSTLSSGVAIIDFYDYGDNQAFLNIGVVDTSNPIWQTSGTGYYNGPIYTLAGTWTFPATFTLISPLIVNGTDWC